MEEHLTSIIVGITGPAVLGIFAFLWKVNSRIATIERDIKAHDHRIKSNSAQLTKHFEKAFTIRKNVSDI
jgi:hypothetical protein